MARDVLIEMIRDLPVRSGSEQGHHGTDQQVQDQHDQHSSRDQRAAQENCRNSQTGADVRVWRKTAAEAVQPCANMTNPAAARPERSRSFAGLRPAACPRQKSTAPKGQPQRSSRQSDRFPRRGMPLHSTGRSWTIHMAASAAAKVRMLNSIGARKRLFVLAGHCFQ